MTDEAKVENVTAPTPTEVKEVKVEVKPEVTTTATTPAPVVVIKIAKEVAKKKINRYNQKECEKELARMANSNDTASKHYERVQRRYNSVKTA